MAAPPAARAGPIDAQGIVTAVGVDGTLLLHFDPDSGELEGTMVVTYHWQCKSGPRDEQRSFDVGRGRIRGRDVAATAELTDTDWPQGYGQACRGPDNQYKRNDEDSMRLVGRISPGDQVIEGTASHDPVLKWRATWTDVLPTEPAPESPDDTQPGSQPSDSPSPSSGG
jgi:hypothetical protein